MTNEKPQGILKGAAWVGSSRVLVRSLGLLSTFVLARLLVPEDFGLVAIATGVVGILQTFTELNFSQALIRFQDLDDDDYSTAWSLNVCRGLLLTLIILLLSNPLAKALDDSRIADVLLFISIVPFLAGLENPRLVMFEKRLRFDVTFKMMVITKIFGVVTTVTLAILYKTYWALIFGMIVTEAASLLLSYVYAPVKFEFTFKSWRKLVGFSGWLTGERIFTACGRRLDPLILAAFATPHVVGVFHLARELSYISFTEIVAPIRRVLFPALSLRTNGSFSEFQETYKDTLSSLFMVLSPICVGVVLTVPDAVPIVLGDGWDEIILPIQYMTACLTFSILGKIAFSAAMARGLPHYVFYQAIITTPVKIALFYVLVKGYGLYGAVFAICFDIVFSTFVSLYISAKVAKIKFSQHFFIVKRSLFALFFMFMTVYAVRHVPFQIPENFALHVRFLLMVFFGVLSYVGSFYVIWILCGRPVDSEGRVFRLLKGKFKRSFTQ